MVTAVKYRKLLLNKEVEDHIRFIMKGITERYDIVIDEIGFDRNHIHIFCGSNPSTSPMQIIATIKSIVGRKIFERFPALKEKELWGGEFWSDGKYIETIGSAVNEEVIRRYIRNQSLDESEVSRITGQMRLFKI
jgi:putative transposase